MEGMVQVYLPLTIKNSYIWLLPFPFINGQKSCGLALTDAQRNRRNVLARGNHNPVKSGKITALIFDANQCSNQCSVFDILYIIKIYTKRCM